MPPRVREANLVQALEIIENGSQRDKLSALEDLGFLFQSGSKVSNRSALDDKDYHRIFDTLFRCAVDAKELYYSGKKTAKSTGGSRLVKCAEDLRVVIEHGVFKLKRKTLLAVVDHITQTLQGPDGEPVDPLLQDYLKALNALLGHPASVEILATYDGEGWYSCVDFAVQNIRLYLDETDGESGPSRASPPPTTTQPRSTAVSTFRSTASSSTQNNGSHLRRAHLEPLLGCLWALVSAPNAPLLQRLETVSSVVTQVLQTLLNRTPVVQTAFAILNTILALAQTERIEHVLSMTQDLVPLIQQLWQTRTSSKDDALFNSIQGEMLKALFNMHLQVECLLQRGVINFRQDVEDLCDMLWAEYSKRDERAQLQLDDLTYPASLRSLHVFKTDLFTLRPYNTNAERKWALLHVLALFETSMDRTFQSQYSTSEDDEHPRKKRRTRGDNRIRQKLISADPTIQFTASQIIPFYVANDQMTASEATDILPILVSQTNHKTTKLSTWAMVASASLARKSSARDSSLSAYWRQLWQVAARLISIPGSCRASCILLHSIVSNDLIPYHHISGSINSIITTADVSGPAILVDSAIILMAKLLHLRNYELPSASHSTCSHVVRWLFLRWDPGDNSFISSRAIHVTPLDLVNLLRAAYGVSTFHMAGTSLVLGGSIAESWCLLQERAYIVRYLMLVEDTESKQPAQNSDDDTAKASPGLPMAETSDTYAVRKLVAELLHAKLEQAEALCDIWAKRGDGSSQISAERLQSILCCIIVAAVVLPNLNDINLRSSQEMEPAMSRLLNKALKAASDASENQALFDTILKAIRPYIPALSTSDLSQLSAEQPYLFSVFAELSETFHEREKKQSFYSRDDMMDLDDDEFGSQENESGSLSRVIDIPRRATIVVDQGTWLADTIQRLHFMRVLQQHPEQIGFVPKTFLDDLLACSDDELLLCRNLSRDIVTQELVITADDAMRVIERWGVMIGNTAFSSCEAALHACLEVIGGLVTMWTNESNDLSSDVGQLYQFFVKTALRRNLLSPKVQRTLASLLLNLTQVNERYPESLKLPTTVDSLLDMLQRGTIQLKFFIGKRTPEIFGRFVLKTHEQLFLGILDSLPSGPQSEGIALRLFVLSELAQRWPTLLRRCVYHIFETPGNIRESTKHATYCLRKLAASLKLENAQTLFDLFAPQTLYTWLNGDSLEDIPFAIFGFSDLPALVRRSKTEAAALMVMRGQDSEFASLASLLGTSPDQLVLDSFSKTVAYSIAYDISAPKAEQHQSGESRVRKLLGQERFIENIYMNFTDIIAQFFAIFDQEDPVEKSWTKDESFLYAAEVMNEIKACGHSDVELPANQQPSFKAKHLVREIALLCKRTEYELPTLWTPALVVAVARKLFNMIHPALGALHACSVVRKVRVLICLAGSAALQLYPVEMLLHSIRPFIFDSECADDALGMSQYLLMRSSTILSHAPSFLAGYALSTLASLRVFLESSQASTTQESQFKSTMSKAQKFHSWFARYLENYQSSDLRDDQVEAFRAITEAAAHVRSSGNAERGTHESNLLLEILRDEDIGAHLLDKPSRDLALGILCKDFRVPPSFRADAVNCDQEALMIASAVWKSTRNQLDSEQYLEWAGRVVGRGFAASGDIDPALLRESTLLQYLESPSETTKSEQGLLRLMLSLTVDSDCVTAGLAESSLRSIVSEAASQEDNALLTAAQQALTEQLFTASNWTPYRTPPSDIMASEAAAESHAFSTQALEDPSWPQRLSIQLIHSAPGNVLLSALPRVLAHVKDFARAAFPFIVHLVLLYEHDKMQSAKRSLSVALKEWLKLTSPAVKDNLSLMINALLYLRTQRYPSEVSIADRSQWVDIDLTAAASAAVRCGMYKTALLFVESSASESTRTSRRSSTARAIESTDVLLDIFENIDDPDAYYGLNNSTSLGNVLARLEYEKDGNKSLAFRGAQYDSHLRGRNPSANLDSQSLVTTLNSLGLSGLSHALLQNQQSLDGTSASVENTFDNARKLEIWNLPTPLTIRDPSVILYKSFQGCHQAIEFANARQAIHAGLGQIMRNVGNGDLSTASIRRHLRTLAALSEMDDVLNASNAKELGENLTTFEVRSTWMKSGRFDDVSQILSCRQTTLSMLGHTLRSHKSSIINAPDTRLAEVKSMILSSSIYRFHQATQQSLNIATALNDLIEPSSGLGLTIDAAAKLEAANALWDHGEMSSSIRMLKSIEEESDLKRQTVAVRRSDLLAKVGYQVSVAKLEKADSIQRNYLQPALKELKGATSGTDASKVYHQFAMFCDEQLQNPDGLEDLTRLQHLRKGKSDEVMQLKELVTGERNSQIKSRYMNHLNKAKQWLDLDEQELRRVEQSRSEFVRLSLENYLLSLSASDDYNNDVLRFTALWLERSEEGFANEAVRKYIEKVPSRKFASLMNQLTSRLLDHGNSFQKLLLDLVYRICVDHPYHGMYQIWSGMKSRTNKEDEVAVLRQKATERVGKRLSQTESVGRIWTAIDKTCRAYWQLAVERDSSRFKQGQKISIKDSTAGAHLQGQLAKYHIPPPTMQMELSADRDYSHVPYISRLEPIMTIASGVSAPKIITLIGSNGERYKQLVKGGNDDLRQDSIMEQVFSAVSSVLKLHRASQQRNLDIRTYKVLPLTASAGLIEFVPNTIPLHEYLMPAHERYHPKDLRGSHCRKEISQVQNKSIETRLATYKKVTDRFQPVLRYFFMENFVDPDDWFAKRTAYTRTTAAISILGHVLGLGDRHGHNILLDCVTGEAVHIDLGVAFEMGRVLPVPEVVPFRLTRDIVDGMGVTKTEGVFRRCCEFTLDALREETYSIMTILDVLRYDPLYSWSISPVRMAKLQDVHRDGEGSDEGPTSSALDPKRRKPAAGLVNEPSEADRALEVVRKKLSKTLSVTATVNDLIVQATDPQNLAVLYSGWAAYA